MALDEHDDLLERHTLDPEPVACRNERRRRRRRWPMRIRRWRIDYVHRTSAGVDVVAGRGRVHRPTVSLASPISAAIFTNVRPAPRRAGT